VSVRNSNADWWDSALASMTRTVCWHCPMTSNGVYGPSPFPAWLGGIASATRLRKSSPISYVWSFSKGSGTSTGGTSSAFVGVVLTNLRTDSKHLFCYRCSCTSGLNISARWRSGLQSYFRTLSSIVPNLRATHGPGKLCYSFLETVYISRWRIPSTSRAAGVRELRPVSWWTRPGSGTANGCFYTISVKSESIITWPSKSVIGALLTLQRGVTCGAHMGENTSCRGVLGPARHVQALIHSVISRQQREQL